MRSPERALLKRAVTIQMVRIKIPSGASGAGEHYCELWPDVNPYLAKGFHSALVSTPTARSYDGIEHPAKPRAARRPSTPCYLLITDAAGRGVVIGSAWR